MKYRGGLPPAFKKTPKSSKSSGVELSRDYIEGRIKPPVYTPPPSPPKQTVKSGLEQLLKRPRSPFTGPGPSTAGKRTQRRKRAIKRRS